MLGTAAELDLMAADLGLAVVYGAQRTNGWLNVLAVTEVLPDGLRPGERSITLNIRDGSLTGLLVDTAITVGGAPYHIRDCGHPRGDGLRTLTLAEG